MLPNPNMSTLKATSHVARVVVVWKCLERGMMATVKLEPLTLAMKEKRQIVAYVVIFAVFDHMSGSLGSLEGIGTSPYGQRIVVPYAYGSFSRQNSHSPSSRLLSSSTCASDIFLSRIAIFATQLFA